MSEQKDDFFSWATDPGRTSDELFTVEVLLEGLRGHPKWPFPHQRLDLDEQMAMMEQRRLDPAYRPSLPENELEYLQQRPEFVTRFGHSGMSDRCTRDVEALRFFPALENINLSSTNVSDLSPLRLLKQLKHLTLMQAGRFVEIHPLDLGQLGEMPRLESVFLSFGHSWPGLGAMATWPLLREVRFSGNILAFAEIDQLPAVKFLQINGWADSDAQLRDLKKFPVMPKLKLLTLYSTSSLEGIERYPTLLNLEIGGDFQDLSPLLRLPGITALALTGEQFRDLTPLLRMPKLREIMFRRERPLDLALLSDAPHLRRVEYERCAFIRTELAALNAALIPEETDFLAEQPRALPPAAKFWLLPKNNEEAKKFLFDRMTGIEEARTKLYDGDAALAEAEKRSAGRVIQNRLDGLLGRGWGLTSSWGGGRMHLNFKRYKDTVRIREIIQLVREFSAAQSLPWLFEIMVEPHGDMTYELEQIKKFDEKQKAEGHWLADVFDPDAAARENQEQSEQYFQYYEMLERHHIHELQQQHGGEIDSSLVKPVGQTAASKSLPSALTDEQEDEEEERTDEPIASNDDDDSGGVALAPPPPAPPGTPDLSDKLSYAIKVFEDAIFVDEGWADRARYGLGEAPVEWRAPK